ncbi:hypothetical protein [Altererythrobacter sp. ZODW24]|uniref:hypothetical protein n=1 Tax=Altererythrobacter sp. ZODW24 TaxID=2185142 RepID=UPI0013B3BEE7|nr:hypothetical protein [Altererythrobacter sp. ZODW24]
MTIDRLKATFAGVLVVGLAGCQAGSDIGAFNDPGFGEANRQTMAAQVVNPDPVYDRDIPATSADHAADAVDRYNNDQVKQPERTDTRSTGPG